MLTNLFQYLRERFPIIPVLLFAIGYSALATGISIENLPMKTTDGLKILILFAGIFSFFLLRQRVVDEFKDSSHDLLNFPDRPVPRGLISKEQLIILGGIALFFEWFLVYLLGVKALIAYVPVFVYSLLMAKEFFVSGWLNRHFNLYLLSHEVIFILFGLFFISVISNGNLDGVSNMPLKIGVLLAAPASVEIVRKFSPRFDKKGKSVHDTYSTVWGRETALSILVSLIFFCALFLTLIKDSYSFLALILASFSILMLLKSSDKVVKIIGAINFLGLAILANIF